MAYLAVDFLHAVVNHHATYSSTTKTLLMLAKGPGYEVKLGRKITLKSLEKLKKC